MTDHDAASSKAKRKAQLLNKIRPESMVGDDAKWQQLKAGQTRQKIFEAAIDCLVESSYYGLSIPSICKKSGVSRGALHHHFAEKSHLVSALTEHLFYRRMDRFITDYLDILGSNSDFVEQATQVHWESMHDREYTAYLEIAIAARTDKTLAEIFYPMAQRFDLIWLQEMVRNFPQWEENYHKLQLVSDFVMAAHMGLLINSRAFGNGDRVERIQELIIKSVLDVYGESNNRVIADSAAIDALPSRHSKRTRSSSLRKKE